MRTTESLMRAQRAFAAGDFVAARTLAAAELQAVPDSAPALALVANAANALHDFAAAAAALERLCALQPDNAALRAARALALNNWGSLHYRDGAIESATALYRQALAIDPDQALALGNLAACAERLREAAEAARCYGRLARLDLRSVAAALGHARMLRLAGAQAAADAALLESEGRARTAADRLEVGREYLRIGDAASAVRLLGDDEQHDASALAATARLQAAANDSNGARARHLRVATRAAQSGDERARFRAERDAAIVLPAVAADAHALRDARDGFTAALHRLVVDWPAARLRAAGVTLDDLAASRFLLGYQGEDDRAIATRYGDWLAAAAAVCHGRSVAATNGRVRRIGLLSARWQQGTIAAYFGSWIGALRGAGFDVRLFSLASRDDAVSAALAAQATHAERLPLPLAAAADRIVAAELDLLICPEIGLDPGIEVLAALRLAPRQWAAWGHPVTTGLPTIDRFISVATMEPDGAAAHYREPLALLPELGTRYARPPRATPCRADFGLTGGPLFAVPHAPAKLHPDGDALLVAIARAERDARFVLVADEVPALTRALSARLAHAFGAAGLDPQRHFVTLPRLPIDAFRTLLASVDVVLDSTAFSGGNTSLDALAQGTPVVTIEGRFMRGRQSAAMARMLGAPDLVAADIAGAASLAVTLTQSPAQRADLSARIVDNAASLFERAAPLQALLELVGNA